MLVLVPIADTSAPVRVPGHCVVGGIRVLPHPSYARNLWSPRVGRVGRSVAARWLLYKEDGHTEEGPLLEGRLKEEVLQAEHLLREPLEAELRREGERRQEELLKGKTLQEEALQEGAQHIQ